MSVEDIKKEAEKLATEAGMQFDHRYNHWVAPRGKFECEQWYAPYYWAQVMNGAAEDIYGESEDCQPGSLLKLDAEEAEVFGLECGHWALIREDSQGFVMVTIHESRDSAETKYRQWMGE